MAASSVRKLVRRLPGAKGLSIACEWLLKRSLATLLWAVWQSGLHPFGFSRPTVSTPGRFYILEFLKEHAAECHGTFLEFGNPEYRHLFDQTVIMRYDVMDVVPQPSASIVADIQHCPEVPDNSYDVIICTQVLEHIANPFKATGELRRILKPGGRLLVTVPAVYPYHAGPHDYWRFTKDSLPLLFEEFASATLTQYGNRLMVIASYWFWMSDHVPHRALLQHDDTSPILLAMVAQKG